MNKTELEAMLKAEKVPENYYDLEGCMTDDSLCLERTSTGWLVYYTERGIRSEVDFGDDELTKSHRS